jgi:hypothetical protein
VSLLFSTSARSFSGSSIDHSLSFSLFLHPQVTFVLIPKPITNTTTTTTTTKQTVRRLLAAPDPTFSLNSAMT